MEMFLHGKSIIAGKPVETSGRGFRAISPLDSSELEPTFHESPLEDVNRALTLAEEAFATYRHVGAEARAAFLERIAEEILALGEALPERANLETGLPLDRLAGERARTVGQLRLFAEVIREGSWVDARIDPALPDRKPLPRPDLRRMLLPLGPVVVFGSSNFPLAFSVAGGDTASALAAGNPVIVKAHRAHPGTSEMVAGAIVRAAEKCGLPHGVFTLLHGAGSEIGIALVKHPYTRAAGFTGSRVAGRALFNAAAARPDPIPVFAEMSSLNPLFILPGALRERGAQIAEGLKNSVTLGVGQFCTKPGLIFGLGGTEFETFAETFAEAIRNARPATMLHPGICRSFHDGLAAMHKVPGVVALAASDVEPQPELTHGEPTVFGTDAENFLRHPELHEEVFGPYTLLVDARTYTDLLRVAHRLEGQLTATIHGTPEDLANATDLLAILERKAGRLLINGFPTGVEVSPAMNHGGPYPATTDERFTSVGTAAIRRFARPLCYQSFPANVLPPELADGNPRGIMRLVNGKLTREALG
ncbi:MAG TPA: aldehyde dehydrogenase (NADP(+)) [Chthoniobacter sp.]|jgi:NADP-dependent aldehyde dehydrogenase